MSSRYVIGIDLGTTNCGVAFVDASQMDDPFKLPEVQLMPVPQLVNSGEVRDEPLLPSALYLPDEKDFPGGSLELPNIGPKQDMTIIAPAEIEIE